MEENQKEVLIIPLHPNTAPTSPTQQTSKLSSPQTTPDTAVSSHQTTSTGAASSPQTQLNATVSSPRGPIGSQLFAELLENHARRNPSSASHEPTAPPPRETTPSPEASCQSPSLSPPSSPQQPSSSKQGGLGLGSPELLKELKQPYTLKHVSTHKGLTTVFSGRGRNPSASSPTSVEGHNLQPLSNGTKH